MHPPPGAAERDEDEPEGEMHDELELDEPYYEDDDLADDDHDLRDGRADDDHDLEDGHADEEPEDLPAVAQAPPPPRPSIPSPPPVAGRPGSQPPQGPILPPYAKSRPGGEQPWYRRGLASKGGVLVVGATVFLVALLAVALFQLGGDESEPDRRGAAPKGDAGSREPARRTRGGGVVPSRVTVSVLNGTTVGGLARDLGDKLQSQGFRLGNVTNSTDQQRAESVVLFATGAEREAAEVGRRLKIAQREPIDPESQTLAGDATVVVITGADLK